MYSSGLFTQSNRVKGIYKDKFIFKLNSIASSMKFKRYNTCGSLELIPFDNGKHEKRFFEF